MSKPNKKGKVATLESEFEREYQKIVEEIDIHRVVPEHQSLVQPSPFRPIQTFTTYSAYEDPI